jgi:3-dehydroquinate synthase
MNAEDISKLIADSVAIKERVVMQDPTEKGLRKILNFGHTIGHAIETHYLHSNDRLLHGEAIAIGMISEGWVSAQFGNLPSEQLDRLTSVILNFFPKRQGAIKSDALNLMSQDKKNEDNRILCSVLDRIGHAEWDKEITVEQAEEALAFYNQL